MALITRFSRLMKADVHAMLDRIEEPDIVLRQAVRDMEQEHQAQQRRVESLKHDLTLQQQQSETLHTTLLNIESQLDDCFAADREDLARELIQRRLELQSTVARLTTKLESAQAELKQRQAEQRDNDVHLQSMRQKLEILTQVPTQSTPDRGDINATVVTQTDIDIAFVQEKQRRSQS